MDEYLITIGRNAHDLVERYVQQRANISFKRELSEYGVYEHIKLKQLQSLYREELVRIKFLKASYFLHYSRFERHQEIPSEYFHQGCSDYCFISHRWESLQEPDPNGRQFSCFKSYLEKLPASIREGCGFWYDYSCAPQMDAEGKRSEKEALEFENTLKVMHLLTTLSQTVILFSDGCLDRSWICAEWILASNISPLLLDKEQIVPFGNVLKFRHLALLILFLSINQEKQQDFLRGNDLALMAHINALLEKTMGSTEASYRNDKLFMLSMLHRHFWYHIRFLGLANQLATAFLVLGNYDENFIELLFKQFILLSADPDLSWTKEALIDIDTMLLAEPDPFEDVTFHRKGIKTIRNSKMEK